MQMFVTSYTLSVLLGSLRVIFSPQVRQIPRKIEEETKYIELMIVNDHLMVRLTHFNIL